MCAACAAYHEKAETPRNERGIHCVCGKPKHPKDVACDDCLGLTERERRHKSETPR
jgi:hypothetical protein